MTGEDMSNKQQEAFQGLLAVWDLADMTPQEMFEAGYRAGVEDAEARPSALAGWHPVPGSKP